MLSRQSEADRSSCSEWRDRFRLSQARGVSVNSSLVHVRPAIFADGPAIARIYNEGIRGRMATFETTERSAEDVAPWFGSAHPLLVAERGAPVAPEVVGWIHASTYRERACYSGIAEFSVYVGEQWRGQRIGDALLGAFLPV